MLSARLAFFSAFWPFKLTPSKIMPSLSMYFYLMVAWRCYQLEDLPAVEDKRPRRPRRPGGPQERHRRHARRAGAVARAAGGYRLRARRHRDRLVGGLYLC